METARTDCPPAGNNQKEEGQSLLCKLGNGGHIYSLYNVLYVCIEIFAYNCLGRGDFNSNNYCV